MRHLLTLLALLSLSPLCYAQSSMNITSLGNWDDNTLPIHSGLYYNDCWGYAAGGKEYAIIGSAAEIHIIDVTTPSTPTEVYSHAPGATSVWRDFKTYGNYLFACADQGTEGLVVYDLSNLPTSVSVVTQTTTFFTKAHNIYIDEAAAKLYVAGANTRTNGIITIDLSLLPTLSTYSSTSTGGYVHDIFVRGDTAYLSSATQGMKVFDFSIPSAPVQLGTTLDGYPEEGYNHSSWLNGTGDYLVFVDETHGKSVKLADVSDLSDMEVVSLFKSCLDCSPGDSMSIVHNPFIKGDLVYLSYYHDGVQIYDISDPNNVTRVGYYDTRPTVLTYNGQYEGCWGVYPYLPSGNILASDMENGLFVLQYNTPLPIELGDFSGKQLTIGENLLAWHTLSEKNHDAFYIERSSNGIDYETIGKVAGHGNTAFRQDYQFADENTGTEDWYYRLRSVSFSGGVEYSDVIFVPCGKYDREPIDIQLGPNPATDYIDYTIPEGIVVATIRVIDMNGKEVYHEVAPSKSSLSMGNWPAGTYQLILTTNENDRWAFPFERL